MEAERGARAYRASYWGWVVGRRQQGGAGAPDKTRPLDSECMLHASMRTCGRDLAGTPASRQQAAASRGCPCLFHALRPTDNPHASTPWLPARFIILLNIPVCGCGTVRHVRAGSDA